MRLRNSSTELQRWMSVCDFPAEIQDQIRQALRDHQSAELLYLLQGQRCQLMDQLHAAQRKVDALDYGLRLAEQKKL